MNRFFHQLVSSITIVGYLLVVTWGPAWHDHHHGHCHSHGEAVAQVKSDAGHSHGHCCCSHHDSCHDEPEDTAQTSPHAPCHSPLHDDDCVVCQTFAHLPLATPPMELVDAGEPVPDWVEPAVSLPAFLIIPVYDSRGPPLG